MIRVQRSGKDSEGRTVRPNQQWFQRAAAETVRVIESKPPRKFTKNVYASAEVRGSLEELFHFKCAYCESKLARIDWDVEHFRPKGRVAEREEHPGYYWLAYVWENLFPSCAFCNQHRKARPLWSGLPGTEGGKADQFPVSPETSRSMAPGNENREGRLLIDPCRDRPEAHLKYNVRGEIEPRNSSRKGKKSIEVFNLSEPRLKEARKDLIQVLIELFKIRKEFTSTDCQPGLGYVNGLLARFASDAGEFSGLVRHILADPETFGISN